MCLLLSTPVSVAYQFMSLYPRFSVSDCLYPLSSVLSFFVHLLHHSKSFFLRFCLSVCLLLHLFVSLFFCFSVSISILLYQWCLLPSMPFCSLCLFAFRVVPFFILSSFSCFGFSMSVLFLSVLSFCLFLFVPFAYVPFDLFLFSFRFSARICLSACFSAFVTVCFSISVLVFVSLCAYLSSSYISL